MAFVTSTVQLFPSRQRSTIQPNRRCDQTKWQAARQAWRSRPVSVAQPVSTPQQAAPLVDKLLHLVDGTDYGQRVSRGKRAEIDGIIQQLGELGKTQKPMEDPQLFANYRVAYTSTTQKSPPAGGLFRTRVGRLLFVSRGLFQHLFAPDTLVNLVCFRLLGMVKGCVALRGRLSSVQDARLGPAAVQVRFEPPRLVFGGAVFQVGPRTSVRIATTYLDERVRVAVGSRGSLFVFAKGGAAQLDMAEEWRYAVQARPLPTAVLPALGVLALALAAVVTPWYVFVAAAVIAALAFSVLRTGGSVSGWRGNQGT